MRHVPAINTRRFLPVRNMNPQSPAARSSIDQRWPSRSGARVAHRVLTSHSATESHGCQTDADWEKGDTGKHDPSAAMRPICYLAPPAFYRTGRNICRPEATNTRSAQRGGTG
jgi:hypothetical protein